MMLIAALGVSTLIANIQESAPASITHIMGESVGGNVAAHTSEVAQVEAMNASNLQTLIGPASGTGTSHRKTQSASMCKAGTRISTDLSPVGVARRDVIPDSALTASSFYTYQGQDYSPAHARLNNSLWWASAKTMGETADAAQSQDEWLRIDLGEEISIRAIETQGSAANNEVGFDFWTTQFKISWSGGSTCEDTAGSVCAAAPAWETFGHFGNPYYSCASLPVAVLRVCDSSPNACGTTHLCAGLYDYTYARTGCIYTEAGSSSAMYEEEGAVRVFDANTEAGGGTVRNVLANAIAARIITVHVLDAHLWPNLRIELFSDCANCVAGRYSSSDDSTACALCPAGSHSAIRSTECTPCSPGTYDHDADPATACIACPEGSHTEHPGATACATCAAGTYAPQQSTSCAPCAAGMHDDDLYAGTPCALCQAGRYSSVPGAVSCDGSCPPGTHLLTGTMECQDCPAGRTDDDSDAATMCSCSAGSFDTCFSARWEPGVTWETWENILGNEITDLTSHPNYPASPTYSSRLGPGDVLELPRNRHDEAADRFTTYFLAPRSGEYTFMVAGDDNVGLWFGPSESQAILIASVPGWTRPRDWNAYPEQTSTPQTLQAGKRYFLQAIVKEAAGGDHLAIGVDLPNEQGTADDLCAAGQPGSECRQARQQRPIPVHPYLYIFEGSVGVISEGKPTTQSNEDPSGGTSGLAVDGGSGGVFVDGSCTETQTGSEEAQWWQVDLGWDADIDRVEIYHRTDCCSDRLVGANVIVSSTSDFTAGTTCATLTVDTQPEIAQCSGKGRFVTVHSGSSTTLSLCEVEVYSSTPGHWDPASGSYYNCQCSGCLPGRSDDDAVSSTPCAACNPGRYSAAAGAIDSCAGICDPGTHSAEGSTAVGDCQECVAGQVDHDGTSATPCSDCVPGKYSADSAAVSTCSDCAVGTYSSAAATVCAPCTSPGYQPDGEECAVVPCPDNSTGNGGGDPCVCVHPHFAGTIAWDVASNAYTGQCTSYDISEVDTQSPGCSPEVGRIAVHETLYCDRSFIFSKVPAFLNNAAFIKTSNTDKFETGTSQLCFEVPAESNIYVLYNKQRTGAISSAASPPSWLTSEFQLVEPEGCPDPETTCDTSSMAAVVEYRDGRLVLSQAGNEMVGVPIDKEVWAKQVGVGQVCVGGNHGVRDNLVVAATPRVSLGSTHVWSGRVACENEPWRWFRQPYAFSGATMEDPEDNVQAPDDGHTCETIEAAGWCRDGDMGPTPPLGMLSFNMIVQTWSRQTLVDSVTGLPPDNVHNRNRGLDPMDACCCLGGGSTRPDLSIMGGTERMASQSSSVRPSALSDHGCEPVADFFASLFGPWVHLGGNGLVRSCLSAENGLNTPECGFQAGNCCPTGPHSRLTVAESVPSGFSNPARADCEPMEQWFAEGNAWRPALEADRAAVVALGLGLGNFSSQWDLEKDPCVDQTAFAHLACDHSGAAGRVFSISVFMGVGETPIGTIAPQIGDLTALRSLMIVNQGSVSGTIPATVGLLHDLRMLALPGTTLSGTIPTEMQNCNRLQYLTLPPAISGTIAGDMWNGWPELLHFTTQESLISGTLPPAYPLKLRRFTMPGCQISGTITEQIGSAQNLFLMLLRGNAISGTLPATLGNNTKMHRLMLSNNMISGSIPVELTHMQDLNALALAANPIDAPSRHPEFNTLAPLLGRVDHLDLQMSRKHMNLLNAAATPQVPILCTMYENAPCEITFSYEDQDALPVPLGTLDLWMHLLSPDVPGGASGQYFSMPSWTQADDYQSHYIEHSARMLNLKNGKYYYEFPRKSMPDVRDYIFSVSKGSVLNADSFVLMPLVLWHGGGQFVRMLPRVCLDPLATVSADGLLCDCAPGSESASDDQCRLCVSVGPNYATVQLLPGLHTGCRPCQPGLIPNDDHTGCVPCDAGLVPDNTGGTCVSCEIGTFRSVEMEACDSCPRGSIASDDHTQCKICPAGRQSDEIGDSCVQCPSPLYSTAGRACQRCPQYQVGDTSGQLAVDSPGATSCRCDDAFYNGSAALHVCFADGYDDDQVISAQMDYQEMREASSQDCTTCSLDVTGKSCTVCEAGAAPTVQAGYTMRSAVLTAAPEPSSREGLEIVTVFRCHIDLDVAKKRCPANSTGCAPGYEGRLCGSCIEGYGMSVSKECQPCEGSGYTKDSLLVLLGTTAGVVFGLALLASLWKAFTLKHFLRCAFQPLRIFITYTQVTSQLGDVLDFTYPGMFGDVIEAIRPITDFWNLFFRALGPSECFGLRGFLSRWMLRVVGLPTIAAVAVTLYWLYDRRASGSSKAATRAKSHFFLATFLCYPTISIIAVAPFICQMVGPNESLLESDDSVTCESPGHRTLQVASVFVIVVVSLGLPLAFMLILVRSARIYERDHRTKNTEIAKRMNAELFGQKGDVSSAEWVIRDITAGRDYCFLMDAYKPEYMFWEVLDMLRKLALGALVLAAGRGTVAQLAVAIFLSFIFFALQMGTMPYKILADNLFRAATELHVFIVITTALVLKNDLSWEPVGESAYDYVLFFSFLLLVPIAGVATTFTKLHTVKSALKMQGQGKQHSMDRGNDQSGDAFAELKLCFHTQVLGLANDSDRSRLRRYFVDGWSAEKDYTIFLSHYKNEAAAEARLLKTEFVRSFRMTEDEVFLDSDNLTDLRVLLDNVKNSDALVLLYSQNVLSRPWCILELVTAAKYSVPIVIVQIQNKTSGDPAAISDVVEDLQAYLATSNPDAGATLEAHGLTANEAGAAMKKSLLAAKDTWKQTKLVFDPAVSSSMQQQQTGQLAQALVESVCPDNADFLLDAMATKPLEEWPGKLPVAVNIVYDETNETVSRQAEYVRDWLVQRVHLDPAKILLKTLQDDPNDVSSTDVSQIAETDCVLFLQSATVLQRPHCLARLYSAASGQVPICSVVLRDTSGQEAHQKLLYDFEEASKTLQNLAARLDDAAIASVESVASTDTVGAVLAAVLPNIISKPLSIDASTNELESQMADIEQTMRKFVAGARPRLGARGDKDDDGVELVPSDSRP